MANVGSGAPGKTLIGNGNGQGPKYADIGTNSGLAAHGVLIGEGNSPITALSSGAAGQVLQSGGASADPAYSVATYPSVANVLGTIMRSNGVNWTRSSATYPSTIITGQVLAGSASDVISGVAAGTTGQVFLANTSAAPSWGTAPVAGGGTGAVTLTNHGILVGQGTSAIVATAAGTAGQVLQSGGASADPAYSTATYPSTASTSGNVLTSDGTNFVSSAPASSMLVTTYTSSDTWNKNSKTKFVEVYGFNGGGSGASGRKGVSTTSGGGGGGGGGGGFYFRGPSAVFDTSETVTIGGSTTGAIPQTGDVNNGVNGSVSNMSSFGNILAASAAAATGGSTGTVAGGTGAPILCNYAAVIASTAGGFGSNTGGSGLNATAYGGATNKYLSGSSGGGGAGYDLVTPRVGGTGASFLKLDGSTVIKAGGIAGTEAGPINGGDGNTPPTIGGIIMGGTGGGGGGGPSAGTTIGNGGNGAIPGGGGGGGSGGITTVTNSGAGGNGARGQITVIEYF